MKTRTIGMALLALLLVAATAPGHAAARTQSRDVRGEFISLGGAPTGYDPQTGEFTAIGISTASGDWNGYWYEDIRFTIDMATGNANGTALQIFTGTASDGTSGSLIVLEHFTVDGSTHVLRGDGEILGGGGDWEGSRGSYFAEGTVSGVGPGTWRAHWIRPRR